MDLICEFVRIINRRLLAADCIYCAAMIVLQIWMWCRKIVVKTIGDDKGISKQLQFLSKVITLLLRSSRRREIMMHNIFQIARNHLRNHSR